MGYMLLVTGGSGSGKSEYAEQRILESGFSLRYYVATMEVFGEEGRKRVEKHREQRKGKGFETLEQPHSLHDIISHITKNRNAAILLECLSNLAANELFAKEENWKEEHEIAKIQKNILNDTLELKDQSGFLVVVTNEIFSDGIEYDSSTRRYQKLLGDLNRELSEKADEVIEVVYGIVCVRKKGE